MVDTENERITTEVREIPLDCLKPLPDNPRYMPAAAFQQLVENIKRDGGLTSTPLVIPRENGTYVILSGNQRIEALRASQVCAATRCLVVTSPIGEERQTALALSHNALVGEDDPDLLRQSYEKIGSIELRAYTGLDELAQGWLTDTSAHPIPAVNLNFQTQTLLFLPEELQELEALMESVSAMFPRAWVAKLADYDAWAKAVQRVASSYDVRNVSTAVLLLVELANRHKQELVEGFIDHDGEPKHKGWVPLDVLFDSEEVPATAAVVIKRALDKALSQQDCSKKNLWQMIELWAADYLAGN